MNRDPQQFNFATFFNQKLKERGLTLQKLSQLSGISMQDLKNLSEGDFDHLPPAPYLRGYTIRLAKILEFDPEIWWKHFESLGAVRASGMEDRLPHNRFAIGNTTRYGWIIGLGIALALYGGLRFSKILGRPALTVLEPAAETAQVEDNSFILRGVIENGDQVYVNGEAVPVGREGTWEKNIVLEPGLNTVEIKGTKFLGKEVSVIRQIVYEPPLTATSTATSTNQ